jgi:hypothetical protein
MPMAVRIAPAWSVVHDQSPAKGDIPRLERRYHSVNAGFSERGAASAEAGKGSTRDRVRAGDALNERSLEEIVEVAVEDARRVAFPDAGAEVLDRLVEWRTSERIWWPQPMSLFARRPMSAAAAVLVKPPWHPRRS